MKFVFEMVEDKGFISSVNAKVHKIRYDNMRKLMLCFENTLNTMFPQDRFHLKEEK